MKKRESRTSGAECVRGKKSETLSPPGNQAGCPLVGIFDRWGYNVNPMVLQAYFAPSNNPFLTPLERLLQPAHLIPNLMDFLAKGVGTSAFL